MRLRWLRLSTSEERLPAAVSWLLLAPMLLLYALVFVRPVFSVLSQSFFDPVFTLEHYAYIFQDNLFLGVLWRTVRVSLLVTLACLMLGYPVAALMARLSGWKVIAISACVLVPLWLSVLVRSYAWVVLLARNGLVSTTLRELRLIGPETQLMFNEGAVVLVTTHVLLPYMVMPLYAALRAIPPDYDIAAQSLGASPLRAFLEVRLKLSLPGVFSGSVLVFVVCLGFFVTPQLVGGANSMMASMLISREATVGDNWGLASALSVLLLVTAVCVVAAFGRFAIQEDRSAK